MLIKLRPSQVSLDLPGANGNTTPGQFWASPPPTHGTPYPWMLRELLARCHALRAAAGLHVRNLLVAWCALVDTSSARVLLAQRNRGPRMLRQLYELPGGKVRRAEGLLGVLAVRGAVH